jgi:hypothetical protein
MDEMTDSTADQKAAAEFVAGFEEAMTTSVPETKEQRRNRFVAILAAIWAFVLFLMKLVQGFFSYIWNKGVVPLWHRFTDDMQRLWNLFWNLNFGIRMGFLAFVIIIVGFFMMPTWVLAKISIFVLLLMPIIFVGIIITSMFPALETFSDTADTLHAAHETYQKEGHVETTGRNIARSVGTLGSSSASSLANGRIVDAIEG